MTFVRSRSLPAALAAAALVAAAVLAAPSLHGQASADNTLTAAEQSAGWQLLFDGKTIDKWRANNGTGVPANWSVADGTICPRYAHLCGDSGTIACHPAGGSPQRRWA